MYMSQLNINLTADFSRALERLMRARGLRSKSEAVRLAVAEAAERATHASKRKDFKDLVGLCCQAPLNPHPRFAGDDDLWTA